MRYPFVCPKCENKEVITMRITEYVATGHLCSKCNTEMQREVKSLVCAMSKDTTGDFYQKVSF